MSADRVVLFVCVRNAGRSQMAEAFFNSRAPHGVVARSAGSDPASEPHPEVVESMRDAGLNLARSKPKGLDPDVLNGVGLVVTMGCGDACPVIEGARYIDWDLPDPAGRPAPEVREIRDEISRRVESLLAELGGSHA